MVSAALRYRGRDLRTLVRLAGLAFAIPVIAAGAGWLEVRHGAKAVIALLGAIGLTVALQRRAYGVLLGIAVLGCLNGIPGIDVNPAGVAISRYQDVLAVAVLGGSF